MYRRPSKRFQAIRRFITVIVMIISVLALVAILVLFIMGYRLDSSNGLEQGALLQFNTQPTGASVAVDGAGISGKTPSKSTVFAGSHLVTMTKAGYQPWTKTVNVKAGTLTWLDYGLLIPTDLTVAKVALYPAVSSMLTSEDDETILLQPNVNVASFEKFDLRQETPTISTISIPATVYSDPVTPGITHTFRLDQFDSSGRYALVQHTYGDKSEWIVVDTQDATKSKNITTLLGINLTKLAFSGTSGSALYGLSDGTIRKLDTSAGTLSKALVSDVTDFSLYETNVISYVGTDPSDNTRHVAGVYQDGDDQPTVLRSTSEDKPLHITTTHYFNLDYVAVSLGDSIQVYQGFPHSADDVSKMTLLDSLIMPNSEIVKDLGFSPAGEYLLAQDGTGTFESYDLEHATTFTNTIQNATTEGLQWLNDATLYGDTGDSLILREFDGTNVHTINPVAAGTEATLSPNGRFLYSVSKSGDKYQLQRVTMVLN